MNSAKKLVLESARRLLRKRAYGHLKKMLSKLHDADIAAIINQLGEKERVEVLNLLEPEKVAGVLPELDTLTQVDILEDMNPQELLNVLSHLPPDEAVSLLDTLSNEKREEVLPLLESEEGLSRLLKYGEETAGRIMTTDYLALDENLTVEEAIQRVRGAKDKEVFYIYVIDHYGHLVGVLSLRQLLLQDPQMVLKEAMSPEVISVRADMDQEEVARIVARYDLLSIPVVDDQNRLVGVITVDDVIDIIQEENTEDIYKMVGTSEDELWEGSLLKIASYRLPWLAFTLVGEMLSGLVMRHYNVTIAEYVSVAFFVPLIMALGGAVGNQSQTIVVRALATGRMTETRPWKILSRQIGVGMIMSLVAGSIAGLFVFIFQRSYILSMAVGISLFVSMSVSALVGALVPLVFKRLKIDPAVSSVPFISTFNDILGTAVYLSIATFLYLYLK